MALLPSFMCVVHACTHTPAARVGEGIHTCGGSQTCSRKWSSRAAAKQDAGRSACGIASVRKDQMRVSCEMEQGSRISTRQANGQGALETTLHLGMRQR